MSEIAITVHSEPDADAERVVNQGLDASNDAAAPLREVRPLSCFARDGAGVVIGGAMGRTWGECAELQQLWVDPAQRRHGLGARLVRMFEQQAASRGCRRVYLDTFSFMAPRLYRALGYEMRHTIAGFAPGVEKHLMLHELEASGA